MSIDATTLVRHEWEEGARRLEAERGDRRRYERLLAQVEVVIEELRKQIGQTYSLAELSTGHAWLGIVCYTLQIYFDFSGYSDMAIGLGRMFGFRFPENFRWPYIAVGIAVGAALNDNPTPHLTVTTTKTLIP